MTASTSNKNGGKTPKVPSADADQAVQEQHQEDSHPTIKMPSAISVQQLADLIDVDGVEVIKQLMRQGVMANINQAIDYHTAATVALDFGFKSQQLTEGKGVSEAPEVDGSLPSDDEDDSGLMKPRAPVVTVLGHVDHGKTTLLDVIRKASVTALEKGGITQHIGAYQVEIDGQKITFLDTPGHEAFTAMRARGAKATDIAVLVVAAEDGVMPQTKEAIDHAKAANIPIVVAVNKIDKPEANADRVKQQLADLGMVTEEWGGDTIVVPVSAKTEEGVQDLLENILLVTEVSELKANPDRKARGVVIEAKLDTTRGPIATVLVQNGTLRVGDSFDVGETWGKVRAMFDDKGQQVEWAEPSTPVEVLGIDRVPRAGDMLVVQGNGKKGGTSADRHRRKKRTDTGDSLGISNTDQLLAQVWAGEAKELNIILKTDVEGSGEAIRSALEGLDSKDVKVKVIRTSSGRVTESDVLLASASKAMVLAFITKCEEGARRLAEREGVEIRYRDVIYDLIKDVQGVVSGLQEPVYRDIVEARAMVKEVFKIKGGNAAGIGITEGKLSRNALARVVRGNTVIHESNIKSLRHFKDSVRELSAGSEGGIGIEGFNEFQSGDVIEAFRKEKVESPAQ